jgi:hypothetical protein
LAASIGGLVFFHSNATSCENLLDFAALRESASDAVDGSSTGT